MPKEIHLEYPDFQGPDAGGSLCTNTFDDEGEIDGYAFYTSMGEFACKFPEYGGMLALFPKRGLAFHYGDEGKLEVVTLSLTSYLFDLADENNKNKHKLALMAKGGRGMKAIGNYLMMNQILVTVTLDLQEGTFSAIQRQEGEDDTVLAEAEDIDYRRGIVGELDFGNDFKLAIEFMDYGDDLFMGVGEAGAEKNKYIGVEVSHYVEYEEQILGQLMDDYDEEDEEAGDLGWLKQPEKKDTPEVKLDPKRFETLAKQVLIAESVIV